MFENAKKLFGFLSSNVNLVRDVPNMYEIRYQSDAYCEFASVDYKGDENLDFNETLDLIKKRKIKWKAKKGKIGDIHSFGFYHKGFSKKFVDLLKANGITNFTTYKLDIIEPKGIQDYYYVDVHCKSIRKIDKEKKGLIELDLTTFFDLNEWGKEDLFRVTDINCHLCTEKVKKIVEENKLTNFKFDEMNMVGAPKKKPKEHPLILTKENLESIDEEELPQFLTDYVVEREIKKDWKREYEIVMGLSLPLRVNYVTFILEGEVNNGGYAQYFFNYSGKFAYEAVEYLELIGAKKLSKITEKALDTITDGVFSKEEYLKRQGRRELIHDARNKVLKKSKEKLSEDELMWGVLQEYESKLKKFDKQFYDSDENLSFLRVEYLKKHLEEILSTQ